MTGPVEPTSAPYAAAKWAGVAMCDAYNRQYGTRFINAIPCAVYGPGDNFDPASAHVISALMHKFHEARERSRDAVTLWGTGNARREFIYADDAAEACDVLLNRYDGAAPVNIGSGASQTVAEIARLIRKNGSQCRGQLATSSASEWNVPVTTPQTKYPRYPIVTNQMYSHG